MATSGQNFMMHEKHPTITRTQNRFRTVAFGNINSVSSVVNIPLRPSIQ